MYVYIINSIPASLDCIHFFGSIRRSQLCSPAPHIHQTIRAKHMATTAHYTERGDGHNMVRSRVACVCRLSSPSNYNIIHVAVHVLRITETHVCIYSRRLPSSSCTKITHKTPPCPSRRRPTTSERYKNSIICMRLRRRGDERA